MKKLMRPLLALCLLALLAHSSHAQIISFDLLGRDGAGLLPGNEVPNAANSTGSGDALSILFDSATNELMIDVDWGSANGFSDLTGDATAMHIHGPADINSNGGVLYNLGSMAGFDASASSGGFTGTLTIASADVQTLLDGETYLNVHTADNGGGELRANLIRAVPEPSGIAILGFLAAAGFVPRRRS